MLLATTSQISTGVGLLVLGILVTMGGLIGASWAAITRSRIEGFKDRIVELERKDKEWNTKSDAQSKQIEAQSVALKTLQDTVSNVAAIQEISHKMDQQHEEILLAIHSGRRSSGE